MPPDLVPVKFLSTMKYILPFLGKLIKKVKKAGKKALSVFKRRPKDKLEFGWELNWQ